MRRSIAAALVAAALVLPLFSAGAAEAGRGRAPVVLHELGGRLSAPHARAALERAQHVVDGAATAAIPVAGTLAMRDLFTALPDLNRADRRQARTVLARPTDGQQDPDGYRARAKRRCHGHFCLHWVTRTSDQASSGWVTRTMRTMQAVWRLEVGKLGYRRPVGDGHHGGNHLFDVYLKDLGSQGLYGYCTPEYVQRGHRREASGYCVLDNDFARSQFGTKPRKALRVTAAHEFFHAIQFGYDYKEDAWLMEATATWMEERFANAVNDNRQYIRYGQVAKPGTPLDVFNLSGYNQYGNWPFFEFLSSRYGVRTIRQIWTKAGEFSGGGHLYSAEALDQVLARHRGLADVFTRYAAGNFMPGRTYAEGDHWSAADRARANRTWTLQPDAVEEDTLKVRHLAARNLVLRPGRDLTGQGWHADITVQGPSSASAPMAYAVVWTRDGRIHRMRVPLDDSGTGTVSPDFGRDDVQRVVLTLANASIRFHCRKGTSYSCRGKPVDAKDAIHVTVTATRATP